MGHHSRTAGIRGAAVSGAVLLLLGLAPAGAQTPPPQMQGSWKLNPDLTAKLMKDLPADAPAESKGHGGSGRGGGVGGGGGGGMGSHGGGAGGSAQGLDMGAPEPPADQGTGSKSRDAVLASLDRFSIALAPGQVTVTDRDGHTRVVKPDGSKARDATVPGGPAQVRASVDKDGALVVEIKPDKGVRRTESFEVSDDGKHLYLTVSFSGGFMARDIKVIRAYDVVAAAAPDKAPAPPGQP
jgi:hypothetical protein